MRVLADWIRAGESGSIVGLAGTGKSNLLGFLCHRPRVLTEQYLENNTLKLALVLVDLNNLTGDDVSTFYRVTLRSLYEARSQLATIEESLPDTVQHLYRKVEDKVDPFVSQSALREVLLSFKERGARLALVLDPFDQFCQIVTTQVLDNLRGLRDSFKTILSYIVGLRHELAYIRDPAELGELYEILDTHVCWLGPMERDDARWVINQVETAMDQSFADAWVESLIDLTGGYPALLRAASLWLAQLSQKSDTAIWADHLLAEPSIQNRFRDLWHGLTSEEQATLFVLQAALSVVSQRERKRSIDQIENQHRNGLERLQAKRLCTETDAGWQLFSPLFAEFIASLEGISGGRIWREAETDRFFRGDRELDDLSERDRRLLQHFLDHPKAIHSIDDLVDAAWHEDDSRGVTDEAVQQAIRHLRVQIELNPAQPCYLVTRRKSGYCFFPEGAPQA
jgi:hypothetical protein